MGANASTAVPLYASGQVLDAARLNLTNAGIPVFSGTATRDAAFGGSGEKVLAEGQFAYLEDTNAVQYYDSAAWQSVGVTPGLTLITSASFSAVTSFSLPNGTFTTTYDNYLLIGSFNPQANGSITLRFRASGADLTTAHYRNVAYGRVTSDAALAVNNQNVSAANVAYTNDTSSVLQSFKFDIFNPMLATSTGFSFQNNTAKADFGDVGQWNGGGVYQQNTLADSLSFISSGANSLTGSYKVYGYRNS